MKNLFKNLIKTAFAVSLMFLGAVFADAAGQFINYDPMNGTVTSISGTTYENHSDSLTVSIPNPGDSQTFRVYVAYQNVKDNSVIYDATGSLDFSETGTTYSTTITGKLRGRENEFMQDGTTLRGLPNSWRIELTDAFRSNNHSIANSPNCTGDGAPYNYNDHLNVASVAGNGAFIDHLDYIGTTPEGVTGVCDQGYLVGYFTVTNTEGGSNGNLDVQTNSATNIGDTGARLNGRLVNGNNANVWFVIGNSSNLSCSTGQREDVSGSYDSGDSFNQYVSGLNSDSHYYYKACADDGSQTDYVSDTMDFYTTGGSNTGDLTIETRLESNVSSNGATLNGRILSGSSSNTYFAYSDNGSVSCDLNASNPIVYSVESGTQTTGDYFSAHMPSTYGYGTYYYRACAESDSGTIVSGDRVSFLIDGSNGSTPYAVTGYVNDITDDSADIHGSAYMNDYNNGLVFYIYGKDESRINNVESSFDSYSDVNEDGDNLIKVEVDGDLDSSDSYIETLTNLDSDEDYYYNFCVEYSSNGQPTLECGVVNNFKTLDNGNNSTDSEIETRNVDNITSTSAEICGDLVDDGGDTNLRTWMEYRRSSTSSYTQTNKIDRGEGYFCETIRGLSANTKYYYRACSDDGCDTSSSFVAMNGSTGDEPVVTTNIAYSIASNSAVLPGTYVTNADKATVWFQYGYTPTYLNKDTRHYTKYGAGGSFVHYFTNLKSNQRYCYRAMIETVNGSDHGSVNCFYTKAGSTVDVIVPDDDNTDVSDLGLGLSLVKLEINDHKEKVTKDENVTYEISWENISDLDLEDLELVIELPRELQITSSSRGQLDQDRNAIVYTIRNLDAKERNSMTVTGVVVDGKLGDALTADATLGFDNPVNEARENATDYDVDEYTVLTPLGTASVFGLANITFLGWLTILLGLLIVFLVARWLYLEREELRAQAYVNSYGQAPYTPTSDSRYAEPVVSQHNNAVRQAPQERPANSNPQTGERTDYRPYRPNRG